MSRDDADARTVGFTSHEDVVRYQAQTAAIEQDRGQRGEPSYEQGVEDGKLVAQLSGLRKELK